MQSFYILCLVAAFSLFLWQSVSDARQSVVQQTMLLVIIISNGGYAALAGAENLREAVLATKVLYTGACFLPMLYFITMCEVCRVHLSRFLLAGMTLLQTLLFGFVCTIGHNNLFYKANNAHGKCLLSFQNLSGIYNKRRGRMCLPRRNFLRKSLWLCLSPLAVSAQKHTASGENSRCNKKAHPAFQQDARKIACGYFQANGINLVHFAPKLPVFVNFIS